MFMSLLVTGSIGIDTVNTPFGTSESCLGGSAVYFSMAASFFSPVRFLGVVGDDCPFDLHKIFSGRDVDLTGLEVRAGSKTFRWQGSYVGAMNDANTDSVELNVLEEAPATLPDSYTDSAFLFLANTAPALQSQLIDKVASPKLIVADTMNLWIDIARADFEALLKKIDGLVLNEGEARMFTGKDNLVAAAKAICQEGPKFVIVKKGEHGTLLMTKNDECFVLPAYPTDQVKDPTGAGDSFAGGMMGYLANAGNYELKALKQSIAYGTVVASLNIENFSLDALQNTTMTEINNRLTSLKEMIQF
jgi:sugar/nucleoside kinase (ribokinase family)